MIHNSNFIGLRNAANIMKGFQHDEQQLPSLDELRKGGEGSKGGKVIGHTKSGKPIYENSKGNSKGFTPQDHREAAELHLELYNKHSQINKFDPEWKKKYPHYDSEKAQIHLGSYRYHSHGRSKDK